MPSCIAVPGLLTPPASVQFVGWSVLLLFGSVRFLLFAFLFVCSGWHVCVCVCVCACWVVANTFSRLRVLLVASEKGKEQRGNGRLIEARIGVASLTLSHGRVRRPLTALGASLVCECAMLTLVLGVPSS